MTPLHEGDKFIQKHGDGDRKVEILGFKDHWVVVRVTYPNGKIRQPMYTNTSIWKALKEGLMEKIND